MRPRSLLALAAAMGAAGCSGVQSALDTVSGEAGRIAVLTWVLVAFCVLVFLLVLAIALAALFAGEGTRRRIAREGVVIGLGIVFPAVTLTLLLFYGVMVMAKAEIAGAGEEADIVVTGERWWWRVSYRGPDGRSFDSANELRIPVGRPVRVALESADVIHSFWVPRLAGKLDMIPGRTNVLTLEADAPGMSRGQCAEYCGGAHALMSFWVVAMEPAEYEAWLAREAGPAAEPDTPAEERGRELFLSSGCGACHTVRGTPADGVVGPDLTHVGGRHSLAAATLPNDVDAFRHWIRHNQNIKPENLMPPYGIFSDEELDAIALWLAELK